MSIEYDFSNIGSANAGRPTSLTISHTISTLGSGRVLLAAIAQASGTISGVTFGGDVMTQLDSPNTGLSVWYLLAPQTGEHNVVVSLSLGAYAIVAATVSFTGADVASAATCFGTVTDTAGSAGSASHSESSLVGERVFSAMLTLKTSSGAGTVPAIDSTAGPTQTQRQAGGITRDGYSNPTAKAGCSDAPGASSVAMAWNYYSTDTSAYLVTFAIHAAPPAKQRLVQYFTNTYRNRDAGRLIIEDAYGREIPVEQLGVDAYMRADGPAFLTTYKYVSNIDDPSVFYIEAASIQGDSVQIKTNKQSLLESLLSRLGGRSI